MVLLTMTESEEVENPERRREKQQDTIIIKDPEQKFLTARQNRNKEKELPAANGGRSRTTTKNKNKDELHKFWSILRTELSNWQIKLDKILLLLEQNKQQQQQGTGTSLHNDDDNTDDDVVDHVPNNNNVRQQLEDLKQELQLLRKHCLSTTTNTSISIVMKTNGSNNNQEEDEEWNVPDFLPVGDLRLLHTEFTNYNKKWEDAKNVLLPKQIFTFRKYRQELARRKALGLSLITGTDNDNNNNGKGERQQSKICESQQQQSSTMLEAGSGLQNFDDVSITIEEDGHVTFLKDCDNNNATKITTESLVLRNLDNCIVRIDKHLQALHLVGIRGTDSGSDTSTRSKITITKPISSAIHITNCHNTTVEIDQQVQQIRLHESSNLICKVNSVSAGTILEDCTGIVFVVVVVAPAKLSSSSPSYDSNNNDNNNKNETVTSSLDVNDFNWLREGIPSPNYRIERIFKEQEKKQEESQTRESSATNSTAVAEAAPTNTLEIQSSDNIGRMEESDHAAKVQTDNKADTDCKPKMQNGDFIVDGGAVAQCASNHQSDSTKEGDDVDDDDDDDDDDDEL